MQLRDRRARRRTSLHRDRRDRLRRGTVPAMPDCRPGSDRRCASRRASRAAPDGSSPDMYGSRSASGSASSSGGGGTNAAEQGFTPPTQFCSPRTTPADASSRVPVRSAVWMVSRPSSVTGLVGSDASASDSSSARMLTSTARAVASLTGSPSRSAASLRASRRTLRTRPSMFELATASARSRNRARAPSWPALAGAR
jgi:hypothetical protein